VVLEAGHQNPQRADYILESGKQINTELSEMNRLQRPARSIQNNWGGSDMRREEQERYIFGIGESKRLQFDS
jgi:hypothetical protein